MANKITSKELLETKDQYTYVDVREADELEEGKIDAAVNIPLGQLIRKARHGDIDVLKKKKIITYCSSGYRGNIAADEINKLGFDAITIEGGYSAWKRLDIEINEHVGNDIVIALDSTGIKVANRGEWIRHKWNVKRGYLKIHVAVDIRKKKIVSMEVTSEEVHDGKVLNKLIDNASENNKVKRVLADGMYDSNKNFRYLSKNHIKPAIKTRRNSKVKSTNCYARNMSVLRQQTNLKRWKHSMGYGQRWMAETVFSCIKRMFGEYVNARKFHNMTKELVIKASLYNMFVAMKM